MVDICPTITASNSDDYQQYIERVTPFAARIHIDLADGTITENILINPDLIWWPGGVRADIHVMYQQPMEHLPIFISLKPQLIIIQAESDGNFSWLAEALHKNGIEVGVALLAETPPNILFNSLEIIDHVLIFSGYLGHYGGQANLSLLEKVRSLKAIKPQLEVSWDGGVNDTNALTLAKGGIDVLNVGDYLQHSPSAEVAYARLEKTVNRGRGIINDN
jgi:ribulose-phosphate 3-epimerase